MLQLVSVSRQVQQALSGPQVLLVAELAPTLTVVSVFLRLLLLLSAEEGAQMRQLVSVSRQVQQSLSRLQVLQVVELA
jgi:hypothetical protein